MAERVVRDATEVRQHWSHYLDRVNEGDVLVVGRRNREAAVLLDRRSVDALVEGVEELVALCNLHVALNDRKAQEVYFASAVELSRGEGLSPSEAFGAVDADDRERFQGAVIAPRFVEYVRELRIEGAAAKAIRALTRMPVRPVIGGAPGGEPGLGFVRAGGYRLIYEWHTRFAAEGWRGLRGSEHDKREELRFLSVGPARPVETVLTTPVEQAIVDLAENRPWLALTQVFASTSYRAEA